MKRIIQKYRRHRVEVDKVVRFLITGVWNTVFGIGIYALLYELLHLRVNYLVLLIPANILAITNAYICHKLFVFKTSGNILREYFRFYVVYGGTALLGFGLMFGLVSGFGLNPVLANCLCTGITVACSYFSHRNFSFRKPVDKVKG